MPVGETLYRVFGEVIAKLTHHEAQCRLIYKSRHGSDYTSTGISR